MTNVSSSSSYIVLARKWRPRRFVDIVGQRHVVRTLMNAVESERVHQAYLFTGSRGIGKTSIARIFAAAVRCPQTTRVPSEGIEWLQACGECPSCKEITAGSSVDVIEIDGASNNGVDAVREIRENAKYLPASGNRKIYIIDEVHMLTTAAFNALLKTLEEPPPHVIFIFATTEPHKIPATILSRVQRFDFKRVTIAQIQSRLEQVTQAEGIEVEAGSLALIARAAEGSMRDSLSLLDQVIAFSGQRITTQSVRESIGLIESQTFLGILQGIAARQPLEAVQKVDQAYEQGHDLKVLTRGLIETLHAVILAKVGGESTSLELSEGEWEAIRSIAELRPLEEFELIFQVLHHGIDQVARSPQPKVVLDILLIKCATAEMLTPPEDLLPLPKHETTPPVTQSGETPFSSPSSAAPIQRRLQMAVVAKPAPNPTPEARPTPVTAPASSTSVSFEGFVSHVKNHRPLLGSILEHVVDSVLPSSADAMLTVYFRTEDSLKLEQIRSALHQKPLQKFIEEYFGIAGGLTAEIKDGAGESLAERRRRVHEERESSAKETVRNHPVIKEASALFGAQLGPIELHPGGSHGR